MPIDPADIRRAISDADDFGHEMRVRNLLEVTPAINFEHGGTYKDPITGKPRQFDFRCSLRKQNALLSLAVECKNLSVESPLVISGTWRRSEEAFHDLIESRTGRFESGSMVFVGPLVYDASFAGWRFVLWSKEVCRKESAPRKNVQECAGRITRFRYL
jgi:hypothetical protein